jgi:hypothetical protein
MPTYIYEFTPPQGGEPERFEVTQRMTDAPLTSHPQTGVPLRRIVTGGLGIKAKPIRRSTRIDKSLPAATPCGCSRKALASFAAGRQAQAMPRTASHATGTACHAPRHRSRH